MINKFEEDYNNCTIRYGDMKKQLAEDMVKFITPIREKAEAIRNDENISERSNGKRSRKSPEKCQGHDGTGKRRPLGLIIFRIHDLKEIDKDFVRDNSIFIFLTTDLLTLKFPPGG